LIQAHGIDAIINDNVIHQVLFLGSLLSGFLSSVVFYAVFSPAYTQDNVLVPTIYFTIGALSFLCFTKVLSSGVSTTFVCLAEDPGALKATQPELYDLIAKAYPNVVLLV
jgi:hypothetical protein